MQNYLRVALIFLIFPLLFGCDDYNFLSNNRYTGDNDSAGNYLILDTKTGNVKTIQNGQIVNIPQEEKMGKIKNFNSQIVPGFPIKIDEFKIKFRDGMYHYRGIIIPIQQVETQTDINNITDKKEKLSQKEIFEHLEGIWESKSSYSSRRITFDLVDIDNFDITSFEINRSDLIRTVDGKGNPIYLSFAGRKKISPKEYQSIDNYTFSWSLLEWGSHKKENKKK